MDLIINSVAALTISGDACTELVHEVEVAQGIRWYFTSGITIALVSLTALAALEREDHPHELLYFRKVSPAVARTCCLLIGLGL